MPWRGKSKIFYFSQEKHYHAPLIYLGTETSNYEVSIGGRKTFLRDPEPLDLSVRPSQPGIASTNNRSVHSCYVWLAQFNPYLLSCSLGFLEAILLRRSPRKWRPCLEAAAGDRHPHVRDHRHWAWLPELKSQHSLLPALGPAVKLLSLLGPTSSSVICK